MKRYVCIHGHFYQPHREDPWFEEVPHQGNASPFRNWNERITRECYTPNAAARILRRGRIGEIINNYEHISFNFGPTLLGWLRKNDPWTYGKILEADASSLKRRGFGNAMAQAYNHIIMPLATKRDKLTQVRWGKRAFRFHFAREAEGMWLPECAVDNETLAILAEEGLKFTVLAPHQASKIRRLRTEGWTRVEGRDLEVNRPYRCFPSPGLSIDVFFYNASISYAISFGDLLKDGARLAKEIEGAFKGGEGGEIVTVATDGETYGHHHRFGEMALAFALKALEGRPDIEVTNFAHFLRLHPPQDEVAIRERTSWGCAHGVDRWFRDCGCRIGSHPEWSQRWRTPLREAMDWLMEELTGVLEREGEAYFRDPWEARDGYIDLVLDPSEEVKESFFSQFEKRGLEERERTSALLLMEMEYHRLLALTSCGWYFDELSRIETRQNLLHAARAIQIAKAFGWDKEEEFIKILEGAKSNLPQYGDGARIYRERVLPKLFSLPEVGVHFAIESAQDSPSLGERRYFSVEIDLLEEKREPTPEGITVEQRQGLRHLRTGQRLKQRVRVCWRGGLDLEGEADPQGDGPPCKLGFRELFSPVAQRIAERFEGGLRREYLRFWEGFLEGNGRLLEDLRTWGISLPTSFRESMADLLRLRLTREVEEGMSREAIDAILKEAHLWKVEVASGEVERALQGRLKEEIGRISEGDPKALEKAELALSLYGRIFPHPDLYEAQNLLWDILKSQKKEKRIWRLARKMGFSHPQVTSAPKE